MSAQIRKERKAYYDILEKTQHGPLDIMGWLEWFLDCLDRAFDGAETIVGNELHKAAFWEHNAASVLNDRQRLIPNRLLDGFEGRLTSFKWAKIAKVSQVTAARDIDDLINIPDFHRRSLAVSLVVAHRSNLSRRVRAFMKWIEDVLTPYLE
jgi:Fic family protein